MYTIFKNDSSVILSDSEKNRSADRVLHWSKENLDLVMRSLEANEGLSFKLLGTDKDAMWQDFKKGFKIIEAAGGVVYNDLGQILLIYRHNTWDLPKGKIDPGESAEEAAVREVQEECGLTVLHLREALQNTYHIYEEKGKQILKITYWYTMYSDQTLLTPQVEEGITELSWMSFGQMEPVFENTYPNIKMLISALST